MDKKVTSIWIKDDKAEIGGIIEEFKASRLSLREILNLPNHMLRICPIFHLILWELSVHLIKNILSSLLTLQRLGRNEDRRCDLRLARDTIVIWRTSHWLTRMHSRWNLVLGIKRHWNWHSMLLRIRLLGEWHGRSILLLHHRKWAIGNGLSILWSIWWRHLLLPRTLVILITWIFAYQTWWGSYLLSSHILLALVLLRHPLRDHWIHLSWIWRVHLVSWIIRTGTKVCHHLHLRHILLKLLLLRTSYTHIVKLLLHLLILRLLRLLWITIIHFLVLLVLIKGALRSSAHVCIALLWGIV